jgi:hypothetical protein
MNECIWNYYLNLIIHYRSWQIVRCLIAILSRGEMKSFGVKTERSWGEVESLSLLSSNFWRRARHACLAGENVVGNFCPTCSHAFTQEAIYEGINTFHV